MKFVSLTAILLVVAGSPSAAFTQQHRRTSSRVALSAGENPSQLTEYMAKAHEEKLKAVQMAEAKKNAEIQVRADG